MEITLDRARLSLESEAQSIEDRYGLTKQRLEGSVHEGRDEGPAEREEQINAI